jgi:hypothetical protein
VAREISVTASSGPLNPSPNELLIRSYALRAVLDVGCEAPLGSPSFISVAGAASSASTTIPEISNGIRNRVTNRPQVWPAVRSGSSAAVRAICSGWPGRNGSLTNRATAPPAKPSSAGNSVSATSMASSTTPAAVNPITVRNGIPTTDRPHNAMITVIAAKTTELPAVPTANGIDSAGVRPRRMLVRCRDRTNSA